MTALTTPGLASRENHEDAAGRARPVPRRQRPSAQPQYDLLLRGGHVIDPRNQISAVADVAIRGGKIAAVAPKIDPATALKTVDVAGLYVTPGLVDIHVHVFAGTGERTSYAGGHSVSPDGFTLRTGVTTVADAGCAGWRNFEEFKARIIDRSRTRVFAFLNIVGNGMRGRAFEHNLERHASPSRRPRWRCATRADRGNQDGPLHGPGVHAGGAGRRGRHAWPASPSWSISAASFPRSRWPNSSRRSSGRATSTPTSIPGLRGELDPSGHANPALFEGRKRGIIFDVGHGGGSFTWRVAVPIIQEGFLPDSISTDLHAGSTNAGMKDMLNVMSKFLALGLSLDEVILRSTWNPAREIKQEQLGHLSVGSPADVAVLRLEKGDFGFLDVYGARLRGTRETDLRNDPARRQDRLRAERSVPSRLDHAAQGLSVAPAIRAGMATSGSNGGRPRQDASRPPRNLKFPANQPFPWRRRRLASFETQE